MISKEQFLEWKRQATTNAFFQSVIERIEDIKDELVLSAGRDPARDAELAGMVKAFRQVLSTSYGDEE